MKYGYNSRLYCTLVNEVGREILFLFAVKHKDESMEDLSVNPAERQTKIKERLKKFFHRRPTMESLVKKGIWKGKTLSIAFIVV